MKIENMTIAEIREYNVELRQSLLTIFLMITGTFWAAWTVEYITREDYSLQNLLAWGVMWLCLVISLAIPIVYLFRKASIKVR